MINNGDHAGSDYPATEILDADHWIIPFVPFRGNRRGNESVCISESLTKAPD
jgi:hypothetical protein